MEFPFVHDDPEIFDDKTVYRVSLAAGVELEVTATDSLAAARLWLKEVLHYNRRHEKYLQVGIATHGENPAVLTLTMEERGLVVHLVEVLQNGPILGRLASFLSKESISFVSSGPLTVGALKLHGYSDAFLLDIVQEEQPTFTHLAQTAVESMLVLDPVVAASDWTIWPLTNDQLLFTSMKAHIAYLATLRDKRMKKEARMAQQRIEKEGR